METFEEICTDYGLQIREPDGNLATFGQVLKQIYYDWDIHQLQDFMTSVMELETKKGEEIFEYHAC